MGERGGGRVFAYGDATAQIDTDFQASLETWDLIPAGEVGDVYFRSIDVSLIAFSGYAIGITPIVDGVPQPEQQFNGADVGEVQCQAFIAVRGTRCAAIVRTLVRTGDLDLHNVQLSHWPVRQTP